ncbi:MAG: hypothetical protein GQ574_00895 [Crocinitomix sp.]|nr:hypothetical protein [Crocinitomix sp.]
MINFKEKIAQGIGRVEFNSGKVNQISLIKDRGLVSKSRELFNLDFDVPESYLELYNQIRGVHFTWDLNDDEETENSIMNHPIVKRDMIEGEDFSSFSEIKQWISGQLRIPSFEEAFSKEGNAQRGYYVTAEYLKLDPHSFIPIDIGPSLTACLKLEEGKLIDNVIIIDDAALEVYDMKINIETYFDFAYKCKLFTNWQSTYLFKEKALNYNVMRDVLPLIFPVDTLDLSPWGMTE